MSDVPRFFNPLLRVLKLEQTLLIVFDVLLKKEKKVMAFH